MRNPIVDDDGYRGLTGGSHDASRPGRSSPLKPRVHRGLILDHFTISDPHILLYIPISNCHALVKVPRRRPVGLRFTFSLRQSSFRDQSHLGTWFSRWTASKHDFHQRPVPRPSANVGLRRRHGGKQHSQSNHIPHAMLTAGSLLSITTCLSTPQSIFTG